MIGIDPGLTGAICLIDKNGRAQVHDIPVKAKTGKAKIKNIVDARKLTNLLSHLIIDCNKIAIEQVSAMPGQGVSSMFSLGDTFGCLRSLVMRSSAN